ncbi:glycosyl transferase family 52 [Fusobacterium necrophorum subsp. funduliforme]|uniref:Glycosyl transferase family 52 n=1 Tax=Fusobacterium necrophorum subsp. funduliforme TaxID=143387 RepID=A0A161PRC6_9FUSO|nr:glycosyl transferase family 52 [Fusobacterium necrophorum subsp. funduliforme]KYL04424.1 glycosyl transferase family 52 [Fusobacterium necrophorum subsp. funduliforme]KYM43446.1 glycosyl transferase family 52 [Fusobacterium necrophorum subsp. funduliforme]KYM61827.1 glycosyl transferase family 52 [Fusobacterium necrophorum subsp. funduliforme]KYM65424.1 glycosyl transferase family 52 [Fusobacterium necrophorum subsp. funduliforme]
MKKEYICISATYYNILLFCLINTFLEKTIFLLSPSLEHGQKENIFYYSDRRGKIFRVFDIFVNSFRFYRITSTFFKDREPLLFLQDHMLLSYIFLKGRQYSLIEDGLANYRDSDSFYRKYYKLPIWIRKIKHKLGLLPHLGVSEQATTIYLRALLPIPSSVQAKTKIIDIFALWEKKTEQEKQWIQDFFQVKEEELHLLQRKKKIVFTQPLSEDCILSEREKIELYRYVVEKHREEDIIIKAHPREVTDYQQYFPNISVLNTKVPMELYLLLGIEIEEAITLFSTTVYSFFHTNTKITFYGTGIHPKIKRRFGEDNFGIEVAKWS